jgi:hypothetical protein
MTFESYLKARGESVVAFVARANRLRINARKLGEVQFYRMLSGRDIHTSSLYRALKATEVEPAPGRAPRSVRLCDVPIVRQVPIRPVSQTDPVSV